MTVEQGEPEKGETLGGPTQEGSSFQASHLTGATSGLIVGVEEFKVQRMQCVWSTRSVF